MQILETERLILRDFTLDDLDTLYALVYADRRVKDTWSGATGTPEEIKQGFAGRHILPESRFGFKAVTRKQDAALIGLMGFQLHERAEGNAIYYLLSEEIPQRTVNFDPGCLEAELTYALGYAFWKQGFAIEMGRAMLAYGFDCLGLGRIIQGVMGENRNSIRLMERLGFRIERGLNSKDIVGVLSKPSENIQNDPGRSGLC